VLIPGRVAIELKRGNSVKKKLLVVENAYI
jgi:hypothetical protein